MAICAFCSVINATAQARIERGRRITSDCTSIRDAPPVKKTTVKKANKNQNWSESLVEFLLIKEIKRMSTRRFACSAYDVHDLMRARRMGWLANMSNCHDAQELTPRPAPAARRSSRRCPETKRKPLGSKASPRRDTNRLRAPN